MGQETEMAPCPFSLSRFSPLPLSLFSPVTQLRMSVSRKTIASKGVGDQERDMGQETEMAPCPFSLSRFSPPFPFFTCHAATKES